MLFLETVFLPTTEWRPGSTGQILSDLDLTSQKEGRWRRMNTLAHYNVSNRTRYWYFHSGSNGCSASAPHADLIWSLCFRCGTMQPWSCPGSSIHSSLLTSIRTATKRVSAHFAHLFPSHLIYQHPNFFSCTLVFLHLLLQQIICWMTTKFSTWCGQQMIWMRSRKAARKSQWPKPSPSFIWHGCSLSRSDFLIHWTAEACAMITKLLI